MVPSRSLARDVHLSVYTQTVWATPLWCHALSKRNRGGAGPPPRPPPPTNIAAPGTSNVCGQPRPPCGVRARTHTALAGRASESSRHSGTHDASWRHATTACAPTSCRGQHRGYPKRGAACTPTMYACCPATVPPATRSSLGQATCTRRGSSSTRPTKSTASTAPVRAVGARGRGPLPATRRAANSTKLDRRRPPPPRGRAAAAAGGADHQNRTTLAQGAAREIASSAGARPAASAGARPAAAATRQLTCSA